jgi:hypothetical protein
MQIRFGGGKGTLPASEGKECYDKCYHIVARRYCELSQMPGASRGACRRAESAENDEEMK